MLERLIGVSGFVGLACLAAGMYGTIYRGAAHVCAIPDGCDIPAGTHHPYASAGIALLVLGCAALGLAVVLRAGDT
jgi:hypothetical protein